ncbi:haloacid dehalogenase [Corynespora cassiicola Philippines]|uniref:Haloacid dehalogenase n=1 Tax=Corynespora cassiicola Philippines TaxID=1448308 RepID=A0A2T2NB71_CORCC|nr:haloacid dehalogenase [Corynespora cassiicola Philippines]
MSSERQIILAFDVYGTLLSTESIAKQLASHFGAEEASSIAAEWRKYQLEYTWRLNSMNRYEPFSSVTRKALEHALAEAGQSLAERHVEALMEAYNSLTLFPDVAPLFEHLSSSSSSHIYPVVFSNGTHAMIHASLNGSSEISPHAHLFQKIVVVEPVKRFKPDPEVYRYLCDEVGRGGEGEEKEVWLVSGNPFDVVGANAVGLRTCWVDRAGKGWCDRLGDGETGRPTVVVNGVDKVVEEVQKCVARG